MPSITLKPREFTVRRSTQLNGKRTQQPGIWQVSLGWCITGDWGRIWAKEYGIYLETIWNYWNVSGNGLQWSDLCFCKIIGCWLEEIFEKTRFVPGKLLKRRLRDPGNKLWELEQRQQQCSWKNGCQRYQRVRIPEKWVDWLEVRMNEGQEFPDPGFLSQGILDLGESWMAIENIIRG